MTSHRPSGHLVVGDVDGFGLYGIVTETPAGLQCHECPWTGSHLGLHAYRTHGLTARDYRVVHGLKLSKGLVSADLHQRMSEGTKARSNPALIASRSAAKATAARLSNGSPISPAGALARVANLQRSGADRRSGRVVVCQECGVHFCPLTAAARRRFCCRSCSARANRRKGPGASPKE